MARTVTHKIIVDFHRELARYHKGINSFYRFNWNEIAGKFRNGITGPALLLESHSAELAPNPNRSTTFNERAISFLVLDFAGKADDYQKQEVVLDATENIVLDIAAYVKQLNEAKGHWLYGLIDLKDFKYDKVGPLWDGMYGWNVTYQVRNKESMIVNPEVWYFNTP